MESDLYQIDAFAERAFEGNPAAVIPLKEWLPDEVLQSIAEENNLSETVFFVQGERYHIRWFTPTSEVDLCGHATLASAFLIFQMMEPAADSIAFDSKSGVLKVARQGELLTMDFPTTPLEPCEIPDGLSAALGKEPLRVLKGKKRFLAVYENPRDIASIAPDFRALDQIGDHAFCITAPGDEVDFVSRFFAPRYGIDEDPVTGSAHCELTPYWAGRLGKSKLSARQLSKRGGALECELCGDRVKISGKAVLYLQGTIFI